MSAKEMVVIAFGLLLLALVVMSPVACTMSRQATVAELISRGGDPIAIKCAIEGDMDNSPMCLMRAREKQ